MTHVKRAEDAGKYDVPGLIRILCSQHLGGRFKPGLVQPTLSREAKLSRLKGTAWNTLMQQMKGPHMLEHCILDREELYLEHSMTVVDRVYGRVYELRCARRFDDASHLEALLEKLLQDVDKSTLQPVLALLLALADTDTRTVHRTVNCGKMIPKAPVKGQRGVMLPDGPLVYGDTVMDVVRPWYTHYPSHLFQLPTLEDKDMKQPQIPDLVDEGFYESSLTTSSSTVSSTPVSSGYHEAEANVAQDFSENIWQQALSYKPSKHRVWENVGRLPGPTMRPYLTEVGPEAMEHLWKVYMQRLCLIDSNLDFPPLLEVSTETLVIDGISMLLGFPSKCFILNKTLDEFSLYPGLHLKGTTPEGTKAACVDLLRCGDHYLLLSDFTHQVTTDSCQAGLILRAFTEAVHRYLHYYRACVMSVPRGRTLLEVCSTLRKLITQMRFLAELCHCSVVSQHLEENTEPFPVGIELLSYLYKHTLDASSSEHYPMMLYLLNVSCRPYLMFIQAWVFHGVCQDIYCEFMIKVSQEHLDLRDKHYWTKGFTMVSPSGADSVPLFLADMANDIFVCGKSINLLRLCVPMHFLFSIGQQIPNVVITFSETELRTLESRCQGYHARMKQIAKQANLNREQAVQKAKQAKADLIVEARRVATRELRRLQAEIDEKKKTTDIRKRKLFKQLQQQMYQDLERRANEKKQRKEEDAAVLREEILRQDTMASKVEEEMKEEAREELIDYYTKLSEAATLREQRALWKVRRSQLHLARLDFLQKEEAILDLELQQEPTGEKSDTALGPHEETSTGTMATDTLPHWAQKGLDKMQDDTKEVLEFGFAKDIIPQVKAPEVLVDLSPSDDIAPSPEVESETVKPHVSQSVVGDIMRAEPVQKLEVEPVRHVGPVRQAPAVAHPSVSSIQDLMYTEPAAKTDLRNTEFTTESDAVSESVHKPVIDKSGDDLDLNLETKDGEVFEVVKENVDADQLPVVSDLSVSKTLSDEQTPPPSQHSTEATELSGEKSSIKILQSHPSQQSTEATEISGEKLSIKILQSHPSQQSTEATEANTHIKLSEKMTASAETAETTSRPHHRSFDNIHANLESHYTETRAQIKASSVMYASLQSESAVDRVRLRSVFGHVSEMTTVTEDTIAPKMKRSSFMQASTESDYTSYQVKSCIKKVDGLSVGERSNEYQYRPTIQVDLSRHVSVQSKPQDVELHRIQRFQQRNIQGHASDSTAQNIMYYGAALEDSAFDEQEKDDLHDLKLITDTELDPLPDLSDLLKMTAADLMTDFQVLSQTVDSRRTPGSDMTAHHFMALPALLQRSVTAPLTAQISLVNQSVLDYFLVELGLEAHLLSLRQYLLLEDGEFGQSLEDQLFEKLTTNPRCHELLNPVFLNNTLCRAVMTSRSGNSECTERLAFALKFQPKVFKLNAPDVLNCLDLTYKVEWPLNIIVTENSLTKYSRIFSFMLQLKRVVWALKDIWHRLKRDALIHKASAGSQFHSLHLYRNEMQYFVKVMQGYIANQVIHVSWLEFKADLKTNVHNLDQLHDCHGNYLNNCLFRCVLNKKADSVMKIIQNIFDLILKFRTQLVAHQWLRNTTTGEVSHPGFHSMCETFKCFSEYSRFLFKVVNKLAIKGYQPHLQELLLRLNFNFQYSSEDSQL